MLRPGIALEAADLPIWGVPPRSPAGCCCVSLVARGLEELRRSAHGAAALAAQICDGLDARGYVLNVDRESLE